MNILKKTIDESATPPEVILLIEGYEHAQPSFPASLADEELTVALENWKIEQDILDQFNSGEITDLEKHEQLVDIEAQKEQARLQAIYQSLQPQAMELVQYMAAAAIEYGVNIDPAHLEGATFADLYGAMYKVVPDEMYERMRVIYENEVIAYHYEGNGKRAADEFPAVVAMAVEELQQ